jgi:hypothetical protein
MSEHKISQVQDSIARAREQLEQGKALERLRKSRDFQLIIEKGYLVQEAVRLVHLKASEHMSAPDKQVNVLKQIDGIGCLASYFSTINFLASNAERSIAEDEETLEYLLKSPEGE